MKIAFIVNENWEENYAVEKLVGADINFYPVGTDVADIDPQSEVLSVFIHSPIPNTTLEKLPNLKLIATRSTGFDHIDLEYCKSHFITVCNVPSYGERTVAEYAFALLLSLTRKIREGSHRLQTDWSSNLTDLRGIDLFGKTLGIVGTGKIGRNVGYIAKGFGMNILAYDLYPVDAWSKEIGAQYLSLDEVYSQSDILTFHTPYNKDTHHLFNKASLTKVKRGVIIVNDARGALIDPEALIEGLDNDIISGAALDVYEHEELVGKDSNTLTLEQSGDLAILKKQLQHERVIATAHNAFNTKEALNRILDTTIATIQAYTKGEALTCQVK